VRLHARRDLRLRDSHLFLCNTVSLDSAPPRSRRCVLELCRKLAMGCLYTNRCGNVYLLMERKTRTGKPNYFATTKHPDKVPCLLGVSRSTIMKPHALRKSSSGYWPMLVAHFSCSEAARGGEISQFQFHGKDSFTAGFLKLRSDDLQNPDVVKKDH
jgi:hypothetical protein